MRIQDDENKIFYLHEIPVFWVYFDMSNKELEFIGGVVTRFALENCWHDWVLIFWNENFIAVLAVKILRATEQLDRWIPLVSLFSFSRLFRFIFFSIAQLTITNTKSQQCKLCKLINSKNQDLKSLKSFQRQKHTINNSGKRSEFECYQIKLIEFQILENFRILLEKFHNFPSRFQDPEKPHKI